MKTQQVSGWMAACLEGVGVSGKWREGRPKRNCNAKGRLSVGSAATRKGKQKSTCNGEYKYTAEENRASNVQSNSIKY